MDKYTVVNMFLDMTKKVLEVPGDNVNVYTLYDEEKISGLVVSKKDRFELHQILNLVKQCPSWDMEMINEALSGEAVVYWIDSDLEHSLYI